MALTKTILDGHEIEYDDTEFKILKDPVNVCLHYIGNGVSVTNPKGNTSCYRMFEDFKGTSLDLLKFDTSNVTDMSFMFNKCYNLKHLNLSNFNTDKVTSMGNMFSNCSNLKTLNISNFNTSNVHAIYCMFQNCKSLKELDISSFCIDNTEISDNIFWNCRSLKTLKVSSDYLQFFSINRALLEIGNSVNIISVNKLDKAVNDLFY